MSNQEIRAKARKLYGKYFAAVCLIGLCGGNAQSVLFGILQTSLAQAAMPFSLLAQFLLVPLTVGAVGCIEPLWTSEQIRFGRLLTFYTPLSRLGQSILLSVIPIISTVLTALLAMFLAAMSESSLIFLLLTLLLLWLVLRLQMAVMLFASGRYTKALDALTASYHQTRGKIPDLIGMTAVVVLPQVLIMTLLQALSEQNNGLWIFTALEVLFTVLYVPYSMLAIQGWVLEQIKDSEQPQESENKRNQSPVLPEIKKGLEPKSQDCEGR